MKFRKVCVAFLSALMITTSTGMAVAATPETVQAKLAVMEKDTYGTEQTGAILDRINKLEKDYDGAHRSGSMMARVDALYDEVYKNNGQPSVLAQLNAIEWNIDHEASMNSVEKRVADMEMTINGQTTEGTYKQRITNLANASFGTTQLPMEKVTVPKNTLIKVALVDPVKSKNLKKGDTIRYKVAADVIVNGKLVFAKGEPGDGTVNSVKQAKNFGRNAKLDIDYKQVKSIDGTYVATFMGEESKKEMKNLAMAAGASLAGIVLLGPIGVIGGAFVNGKNIDLPAGTEFYIQTKNDTTLYGVATTAQ
ncbi:hypothetical protein SELR_03040 [Selenomonas ruminantium subsp. lactilytica TAM6421]|uniref:Uncharacterized protein n=1 Tax=Selenomonas ruminantium subsp. lactilytica (strain NBRC 103574 / TAM6421) TaxID=927704 RepID=I0GMM5_SELRL|nr:hypothetical protein [Selenomonas ruminantium]BAL82012.1 hypothetical protein SELR_03040 [Selenomonas ruminantium subsp. lactilytica TAM6421]